MQRLPAADLSRYPADAVTTVTAACQGRGDARRRKTGAPTIRSRRAGLGSLGRPRLVALTQRDGGQVAREAKALAPSAWEWAGGVPDSPIRYPQVLAGAVRDADPYTEVHDRWLVRRLAPDGARIELSDLRAERDEKAVLHSMGFEVANVHLASLANAPGGREPPARAGDVLDDLADRNSRHPDWLVTAAEQGKWRLTHGPPRKVYRITEAGRSRLDAAYPRVDCLSRALSATCDAFGRAAEPAP